MKFEGVIVWKSDVLEVGANAIKKIDFVVEEVGNKDKKNQVLFAVMGEERVNEVSSFCVGDTVEASLNAKVSEYNGKRYMNLNAWKMLSTKLSAGKDELPF